MPTRSVRAAVRITPQEQKRIIENAEKLNVSTSAYLRLLANLPIEITDKFSQENINDGAARMLVIDKSIFGQLRWQLSRIGNNLNQATRALNTIANKNWLRLERAEEYLKEPKKIIEETDSEIEKLKPILVAAMMNPILNLDKLAK